MNINFISVNPFGDNIQRKGVYMNRESGPLWTSVDRVYRQYPWLAEDAECSVCVIGGGLTGALCALRLAQEGENVILLTSGQIGYAATADSSPCVSFDFGHRIVELKRRIGADNAVSLLRAGERAIDIMESLTAELDGDFGFRRCDSLLYTNDERELELFNREYLIRKHNGFDCSFMNKTAARDIFSFPVQGGIFSKGLAARFDPYALTHLCLEKAVRLGARVFENTKVEQLDSQGKYVVINTDTRQTVFADNCVLAIGSAFAEILNVPIQYLTGFYSVSTPVKSFAGWTGKCVVRTWAQPGFTISPTPDNRIYCGGLETSAINENGKLYGVLNATALSAKRYEELENAVRCHFPAIDVDNFEINRPVRAAVTQDMLPIIGTDDNHAKCFFACCTGNSAALYSMLASDMMTANLSGVQRDDDFLFSPVRFSIKQARSR